MGIDKDKKLAPQRQKMLDFVTEHYLASSFGGAYIETGSCKPWDKRVFNWLLNNGYIQHVEKTRVDQAYIVKPKKGETNGQ